MKKSLFTIAFILLGWTHMGINTLFITLHAFSIPFGASVLRGEIFGAYNDYMSKKLANLQNKID